MVDQVTGIAEPGSVSWNTTRSIQPVPIHRICTECGEELQRKPIDAAYGSVPEVTGQPRSLSQSLNPSLLSDEKLYQEIGSIRQWLHDNPGNITEKDRLMIAMQSLEDAVRQGQKNKQATTSSVSKFRAVDVSKLDDIELEQEYKMLQQRLLGEEIYPERKADEEYLKTVESEITKRNDLVKAKRKVKELRNDTAKGQDPNKAEREKIEKETGVVLDRNPYIGISDIDIDAVWEASASGHQPPWVLLAIWAKEGSTTTRTTGTTVNATSIRNARSIVRSSIYYTDLGADHFIHYTAGKGVDNIAEFTDADASQHDSAFENAIRDLVIKKFLASDPSNQINDELKVTNNPNGSYTVEPTTKFYTESLRLVDAYFSSLQNEKSYKELGDKIPSTAMTYVKWNLRSFEDFIKSAEQHRKEPEYSKETGEPPTVEKWALEKRPKKTEWEQPRLNAIRFKFYLIAFEKIFAAGAPEKLKGFK